MFGFLRRKRPAPAEPDQAAAASGAGGVSPATAPLGTHPPTPASEPAAESATGIASVAEPVADTRLPTDTQLSAPAEAPRQSWFQKLKGGLARTRSALGAIFTGSRVDEALYEELEAALLAADAGVATTEALLERLRRKARSERIETGEALRAALRDMIAEMLAPLERPIDIDQAEPLVMMVAGVNGAGKTTSIGKLARHLQAEGKSVLLAAGDTFRAAAREQLARWGERNGVEVIAQQGGDPAAVAFDAVSAGRARGTGVVIIDTAGRLPTQLHLMEELRKIKRVTGKALEGAPHEILLVLDGNTGQNMLAQVKAFDDALGLTGLVITKLDGTAKGGAIAALAHSRQDRPIPVYFIGVGEGLDDLQAFSAQEFASALLGA